MRLALLRPGLWLGVATWAALFGLLLILTPIWPQSIAASVMGFALVFAGLGGVVLFASVGAAAQRDTWRTVLGCLAIGVALIAGGSRLPDHPAAVLMGAGLLLAGAALGARIGWEVQSASYLWPLVLVALGADIWSVTTPEGVTHQMMEDGLPPGVPFIILTVPVPGVGLSPVLGIGDVLFTALFLGAVARLSLSLRRALLGLAVGFAICLGLLIALALPIPALPFLGLAGVIALGRSARPEPKDLLTALGFVAAVFLIRWVVL